MKQGSQIIPIQLEAGDQGSSTVAWPLFLKEGVLGGRLHLNLFFTPGFLGRK